MDLKALRPRVFAADPESEDSKRQWLHRCKSFMTLASNDLPSSNARRKRR